MRNLSFDLHLPNPNGHLVVRDKAVGLNHRYAVDLHAPDFSKFDLLTAQEKADCATVLAAELEGKQIDAPLGPEFPEPPLDQKKAVASARIDTDAERARQVWATGGDLQSLVYEGKRREAAAYAVDGTPDPSTYPLLAAEIGLTADSLAGVAAIVSAKSAGWTQAAAAIERIRVGAKMGIDAATDQAGIDAVIAGMNPWPVP
jgi:hypothetical protein